VAGATVDVWHASPNGLYENQEEALADMNLRGRFSTDAQGCCRLRTVVPAGYPVPTAGPCSRLLDAQGRHPIRPAHPHFMASSPGHRVLVTQVFPRDHERLGRDPVFGVTAPQVRHFENTWIDDQLDQRLTRDFHLTADAIVFPTPPIP